MIVWTLLLKINIDFKFLMILVFLVNVTLLLTYEILGLNK